MISRGPFLIVALTTLLFTSSLSASGVASPCAKFLAEIGERSRAHSPSLTPEIVRQILIWWMEQPDDRQAVSPERRPKFATAPFGGQSDLPDPVREIAMKDPDGQITWRVYSTGAHKLEALSQDALYRGGVNETARTRMLPIRVANSNPQHSGEQNWDMLAINLGEKQIGYAGTMPPRATQLRVANFEELPTYYDLNTRTFRKFELTEEIVNGLPEKVFVDRGDTNLKGTPDMSDNHSRSRTAFDITYEKNPATGEWNEVWIERGPVFPYAPTSETNWIAGGFRHSYGGRPVLDEKNQPWRDEQGYLWMILEAVTEQRTKYFTKVVEIEGQRQRVLTRTTIPYKTESLAIRLKNEYQAFAPGEKMMSGEEGFKEVILSRVEPSPEASQRSGLTYYPATVRDYDLNGNPEWFLREGGANVGVITIEGQKFWVKSESPGNFVDQNYNVILSYRRFSAGPIGPYTDILTARGDLKLFFAELSELGLSWGFGRADFSRDSEGRSWLRGHAILKDDLPAGSPLSGWPDREHFPLYFRRQILLPVTWSLVNGEPTPHLEPVTLSQEIIERYQREARP